MERRARERREHKTGSGWERAGYTSLAVALIGVLLVVLMVWVENV